MKAVKTWFRRMADYSQASIRRQVLILVLGCGLSAFFAALLLFGYSLRGLQGELEAEGRDLEEVVAESVGGFAGKRTRAWLRTSVRRSCWRRRWDCSFPRTA